MHSGWWRRRRQPDFLRPSLTIRDLVYESSAGTLQQPWRTALTALGTVLGVAAFVAILGLTATAGGQIGARFDALTATEIRVEDAGGETPDLTPNAFPADADERVKALRGVREAGVWWRVHKNPPAQVKTVAHAEPRSGGHEIEVLAASPGMLQALHPTLAEGRLYDNFHDSRAEHVVVIGSGAASRLGINNLVVQPAVFIDGIPFTVLGIIDDVDRLADVLFAVLVPRRTAEDLWGQPDVSARASMLIDTHVGAAEIVGDQAALALRPDAPDLFRVVTPPNPNDLRDGVTSDLRVLYLLLALVCLAVGAVGITNTTMVAVLERVPEIGLRRALGARRHHIAGQFLTESVVIGTMAGLIGTSMGVLIVVVVAIVRQWTPLIGPWIPLSAPLVGTLVGLLAGAYPAIRAASVQPATALRR